MDIDYLLWLQGWRQSSALPMAEFFSLVSNLIYFPLWVMGFIFLYWRIDKKAGIWILGSLVSVELARAAVKLGFAVQRPFILDTRLVPVKLEKGFSFPSGHAAWAVLEYGCWALWFRKLWLWAVAIGLILLTGFSRNVLGVHTPQDVLVGYGISALMILAVYKLNDKLEQKLDWDELVLGAGLLLCVAVAYYISNKAYPADIILNHRLFNSAESNVDQAFASIGLMVGFVISWYVDRKWLQYTCPVRCGWKESFWGIVGLLVCAVYGFYATALLPFIFTAREGYFWVGFTFVLMVMLFWPWLFKRFNL